MIRRITENQLKSDKEISYDTPKNRAVNHYGFEVEIERESDSIEFLIHGYKRAFANPDTLLRVIMNVHKLETLESFLISQKSYFRRFWNVRLDCNPDSRAPA